MEQYVQSEMFLFIVCEAVRKNTLPVQIGSTCRVSDMR
jgi:hypothetical protein